MNEHSQNVRDESLTEKKARLVREYTAIEPDDTRKNRRGRNNIPSYGVEKQLQRTRLAEEIQSINAALIILEG